ERREYGLEFAGGIVVPAFVFGEGELEEQPRALLEGLLEERDFFERPNEMTAEIAVDLPALVDRERIDQPVDERDNGFGIDLGQRRENFRIAVDPESVQRGERAVKAADIFRHLRRDRPVVEQSQLASCFDPQMFREASSQYRVPPLVAPLSP